MPKRRSKGAGRGRKAKQEDAGGTIPAGDGTQSPPLPTRVRKGKLEVRGLDAGLKERWLDPKHAAAMERRGRIPTKTVERARTLFLEALEVLGEVATRKAVRSVQDSEGEIHEIGPTFAESTAAATELRKAAYGDKLHLTGEGGDGATPTAFTVVVLTGTGPQPSQIVQMPQLIEITQAPEPSE